MNICACVEPDHERVSCPQRPVLALRATLCAGLYGDPSPVRLLNPAYGGDDATCRRFALLEIE